MKVKLANGELVEIYGSASSIGYVAEEITITGRDAKFMNEMMLNHPDQFRTFMAQFLMRFTVNRAPAAPKEI